MKNWNLNPARLPISPLARAVVPRLPAPLIAGIGRIIVNMKFTVILEREPDGGYVAKVPSMPGCVSQGDTREEAMSNIREAAELYLEDCIAAGDPIPTESESVAIELDIPA